MLKLLPALALAVLAAGISHAADKPNILVLWGDDIGQSNTSTYTHGLVGYQAPNIDRIANEGMTFTDYHAEQSCTAGRASFIMGQSVFRSGLSKVALPGAKEDMNEKEPTIAGMHNDAMNRDYKVHLDGYDLVPFRTGETDKSPRKEVFYFSDDGDLTALRYGDWKLIFMEQRAQGTFRVWMEPFVPLRVPLIFNLRRDPYERSQLTSNTYYDWLIDRAYLLVPAQAYVGQFLATFREYPPRQKAASFSLDQVMETLTSSGGSH